MVADGKSSLRLDSACGGAKQVQVSCLMFCYGMLRWSEDCASRLPPRDKVVTLLPAEQHLNMQNAARTLQAMKPPMAEGMTTASLPPASIRSASPRLMCSAALQGTGQMQKGFVERVLKATWRATPHPASHASCKPCKPCHAMSRHAHAMPHHAHAMP